MVGTPRGSPNDIVKNHNSVVDNVKSMIDIPSFAGPVVRPGSLWMRKSNPVIRSSRCVAFLLSLLCKFDYTQLCSCYYYGIKTGKTATGGRPRGNSLFSPFLPKMVVCPRVNLMKRGCWIPKVERNKASPDPSCVWRNDIAFKNETPPLCLSVHLPPPQGSWAWSELLGLLSLFTNCIHLSSVHGFPF